MGIEDVVKQKNFPNVYIKTEINLLYTAGWIQNHNNKFFKPFDISMQQFNVLRILRGQYPNAIMLSQISERMIDRMSNATRLVEKLRQKGLVSRKTNAKNRRQVDILITEKGLELLSEIDTVYDELIVKYKKLDVKEAETLNMLLDKMRDYDKDLE